MGTLFERFTKKDNQFSDKKCVKTNPSAQKQKGAEKPAPSYHSNWMKNRRFTNMEKALLQFLKALCENNQLLPDLHR